MNGILKYKNYLATVEYSTDDDIFFGKVHGVNDLITFEGSNVTELKKAFREAINDYLKTCKSLNKSPDKSFNGVFNVRVDSDLHRKASIVAAKHQQTLNQFVKTALSYAVNHEQEIA